MAAPESLTSPEKWQEIRQGQGRSIIFKHSTICPISSAARDRFVAWLEATSPALPIHEVLVVEDRPLSQQIAGDLDVEHQSPQAILIENGRALWHASHWAITKERLSAAVADPTGTPSHSTSLVQAQAEHKAELAAMEAQS
jgi:bacillithiol system protein YtxJ